MMADFLGNTAPGMSPEDAAARQSRAEILAGLRGNDGVQLEQAVSNAIERHQITPPVIAQLMKRARMTPAQEKFKRLTLPQAIEVFKVATPREKALFAQSLVSKIEKGATVAAGAK